jgi:beta-glucanase (GH16 family)
MQNQLRSLKIFWRRLALCWGATVLLATSAISADWKLSWSEEFNGSSIDTGNWQFETGNHDGWGNHELEYYTGRPENAYVSNGLLHVVARRELTNGFTYTSARLNGRGLFSTQYGRIEFRARVPAGKGYWPALWLMPENSRYGGWPACGEIDVMENRGNYPAVVQGTIHFADTNGEHLQATKLFTFPQNQGATDFHTYVLDWTTNSISWSVNGQLYETQTNWSTVNAPYPAPFDQPFYIIINLAVGGAYGGNPDASTVFPGELQVDYIRVYKKAP